MSALLCRECGRLPLVDQADIKGECPITLAGGNHPPADTKVGSDRQLLRLIRVGDYGMQVDIGRLLQADLVTIEETGTYTESAKTFSGCLSL